MNYFVYTSHRSFFFKLHRRFINDITLLRCYFIFIFKYSFLLCLFSLKRLFTITQYKMGNASKVRQQLFSYCKFINKHSFVFYLLYSHFH